MTFEEELSSTDWNPWLQNKSHQTIIAVAKALCDMMPLVPADAAVSLRYALCNACKIYVHTIEMTMRIDLGEFPSNMGEFIFENPGQTEALLEQARHDPLVCSFRVSRA